VDISTSGFGSPRSRFSCSAYSEYRSARCWFGLSGTTKLGARNSERGTSGGAGLVLNSALRAPSSALDCRRSSLRSHSRTWPVVWILRLPPARLHPPPDLPHLARADDPALRILHDQVEVLVGAGGLGVAVVVPGERERDRILVEPVAEPQGGQRRGPEPDEPS